MIILCLILLIALADDLQKFISSNQSVWQGSIFKVRQIERGGREGGRGKGGMERGEGGMEGEREREIMW